MPQAFTSWARQPPVYTYPKVESPTEREPPFEISPALNSKLVLTDLHAVDLEVDALVVGNNEALTDRTGETGEVFERGGPLLTRDAAAHAGTRTGESRITDGHLLHAQKVVHSIGPRYQAKYAAAAESALHWCYRSALQLCREHGCRTVALCALHSPRKGYPADAGAHCALRTLRRFLEQDSDKSFDAILLVLPEEAELEVYRRIAPLYFPRTQAEVAASAAHLPDELGDAHGELLVRERQVRVSLTPGSRSNAPVPISLDEGLDSFRSFSSVQPSPDERPRLSATSSADSCRHSSRLSFDRTPNRRASSSCESKMPPPRLSSGAGSEEGGLVASRASAYSEPKDEPPLLKMAHVIRDAFRRVVGGADEEEVMAYRFYRSLIQRAEAERTRLDALAESKVVYRSGVDVRGRPAVVMVGSRIHARCASPATRDELTLLLVRELALLGSMPFVVVFVATGMPQNSGPTFDFLRILLSALPLAVVGNLHRVHLLHPSLKMRVAFSLLGALLWGRVDFVDAISQLHASFAPGQLWLPEYVVKQDEHSAMCRGDPTPPVRASVQSARRDSPPGVAERC